ncbi:MAG: sensor domain-containing diguanylate cyclase [Dokdonella sp.]|uniref:GGDEF domain-containing protein n=1 Tax=Dokdonella sp. TaxID=2291710 RepID=UPI0032665D57
MIPPPSPDNELERLVEIERLGLLDSEPEGTYDDLARLASAICGTPVSLVSLIGKDRQWFKARVGMEATQTSRDVAFCAHAINEPDQLFVVRDAREDPRFSDNPLVTGGPNIRFYAGAPLKTASGNALGTLCVIDTEPRTLEPFQVEAMRSLSRQVVSLMELRRAHNELRHHVSEREWYEINLKQYQQELERENLRLSREGSTDALTGLTNRRGMNEHLAWRIARAQEGEALHLAILDIDHFKMINDLHGHPVGDETLAAVARVLRMRAGNDAMVARAGGEEFVLVLTAMDSLAAIAICEELREAVERMGGGIPVTISIGLSTHRPGEQAGALYRRADEALYDAKRSGRNRLVLAL